MIAKTINKKGFPFLILKNILYIMKKYITYTRDSSNSEMAANR